MVRAVAGWRAGAYWAVAVALAAAFAFGLGAEWKSTDRLHSMVETAAAILALIIGSKALVRYATRQDAPMLFLGVAFLGTGILDGYHAIVTTPYFATLVQSELGFPAPWSWSASRLFLAVAMALACLGWPAAALQADATRVYAVASLATVGFLLFFAFAPLPAAYAPDQIVGRPAELIPALVFLAALAGYLRKGAWRRDTLDHWVVLSLVIAIFGQAAFMAFSRQPHDPMFGLAHLAKIAGYVCVLTGLLISKYEIFQSAEEGNRRFRSALGAMNEGFALYDPEDRLVAWNDRYEANHRFGENVICEGMPFEALVRNNMSRVLAAAGREEEYVAQRLAEHRNPAGPITRQIADGRWFILNDARTAEGGIVTTEREITDLKTIEAQLARQGALLQGTIDAMAALISVWDRDQRLLAWNIHFADAFGNPEPLRLGMSVKEIFLNNARRGDYGIGDPEALAEKRFQASADLGWNRPFEVRVSGRLLEMTRYRLEGIGHVTVHRDVTDRRRIEAELAEKSALLEATLDAMEDGLSVWDKESRLLAANQAFEALMGGPHGAPWTGMHVSDLFLLNARNGLYGPGDPEALAAERYKDRESALGTLGRQYVDFAGRGSFEVMRNGMPDGRRVTIHRNITDVVVAEERLSQAVENLSEVFALWDPDDRLVFGNRRFRELNAGVPDLAPGTTFEDYIRALVRANQVPDAAANPGQWIGRRLYEHRHPGNVLEIERDGQEWFLVHEQRLADGSTAQIAADISEVKRAELRVREREQRLRAIVDNVVDGIVTFDRRGFVLSANPAAAQIFRCAAEDIVDRQVGELFAFDSGDETPALARVVGRSFDTIGEIREMNGCRSDGNVFPMEVAVTEVSAGRDRFYIAILRDISARHEMDRMKNEFVSTVSHELRTPLTSIRGSLGLVVGGAVGPLPDKARELVEIAERNANRLIGLVNDILDMEKIESGRMEYHFEDCPVAELVRRAMADNKGFADGFGVTLTLVDQAPGAVIRADKVRMAQVLANLLSNAAKFSPRGGTVEIRIAPRDLRLRVSVVDHGPGIPEGFRSRIFDKFTQLDSSDTRKVGGTGLGLSITRAILERHGGTIDFDSKVGEGTTFYFEVPFMAAEETAPAPSSATASIGAGRPAVLVCEDDFDIARLISILLQRNGYDVSIARTAAEARALLDRRAFAAMTVDLVLPDDNGITLIRELRDHPTLRDLPIVILSASIENVPDAVRATCVQVVDWIAKPIDETRLAAAIALAVGRVRNGPLRILHIEDDDDIVRLVRSLVPVGAALEAVRDLRKAERALRDGAFDLVILDITLADGSGLDLLPVLKSNGHSATPVLLFTGQEVDARLADQVAAALIKSRTSNDELVATIDRLIKAY